MENIAWMAWTLPTAIFFVLLAATLAVMTWLAAAYPEAERVGILRIPTTRGDRLFISLIMAAVDPSVMDRICRHRHDRDRPDREKALNCRACGSPP